MTIRTKLLGICLSGIAVVAVATIAASYYTVEKELGRRTTEELNSKRFALDNETGATKRNLASMAAPLATHPSIVTMVARKDSANLANLLREMLATNGYHVATVSDSQGLVVARGHSQKHGDSVLSQQNVAKALQGVASTGFEQGTEAGFSVRAGHPIREGGRVIGCLTLGFDFARSELVDLFKKTHNVETTLFQGDTRVATTIMNQGKRAIGTKMQDQNVVVAVLKNGEVYRAVVNILGQPYDTAYWPVKDADGHITGMFFVGMNRDLLRNTTRQVTTTVGFIALIVGLLMTVVAWVVVTGITRQIDVLRRVADSLALGDCDAASHLLTAMDRQ